MLYFKQIFRKYLGLQMVADCLQANQTYVWHTHQADPITEKKLSTMYILVLYHHFQLKHELSRNVLGLHVV